MHQRCSQRCGWPCRQRVNPWGAASVQACDRLAVPREWTTLVLKQLPDGCSQQAVVELLDSLGFAKQYSFVYAPMNFRTHAIFGFCFVNFIENGIAQEAKQKLSQLSWANFNNARIEAHWSEPHQGLEVHIERYRNCPVMHRAVPMMYKPLLLQNGRRIPFPKPTRAILPPKDFSRYQRR